MAEVYDFNLTLNQSINIPQLTDEIKAVYPDIISLALVNGRVARVFFGNKKLQDERGVVNNIISRHVASYPSKISQGDTWFRVSNSSQRVFYTNSGQYLPIEVVNVSEVHGDGVYKITAKIICNTDKNNDSITLGLAINDNLLENSVTRFRIDRSGRSYKYLFITYTITNTDLNDKVSLLLQPDKQSIYVYESEILMEKLL